MTELLVRVPSIPISMWFGFQFNLSDSSDDDLYRLDFNPEGHGQRSPVENDLYIAGIIFWCT